MKNLLRDIALGTAIITLSSIAGYKTYDRITTIEPDMCEYWVKADTHESLEGLWKFYMAEDIKHNTKNWEIYQKAVAVVNNGKSKGLLVLPDLDDNGFVGK
jgi:hypothetical protein